MLEVHGSQGRAGSSPAEGTDSMRGSLAQWLEHFIYTEGVEGSSPSGSTKSCNMYHVTENALRLWPIKKPS